MKRILINKQEKLSDAIINEYKRALEPINNLLESYNNLPILEKLTTKKAVFEFLTNPVETFHKAILRDTGFNAGKNTPNPKQVALMYGIEYDDVIERIQRANIKHLQFFDWVNGKVLITSETETVIRESRYLYTQTDLETNMYKYFLDLCDTLTNHVQSFKVDAFYLNRLAHALNLKLTQSAPDLKYSFEPDIQYIREQLKRKHAIFVQ